MRGWPAPDFVFHPQKVSAVRNLVATLSGHPDCTGDCVLDCCCQETPGL